MASAIKKAWLDGRGATKAESAGEGWRFAVPRFGRAWTIQSAPQNESPGNWLPIPTPAGCEDEDAGDFGSVMANDRSNPAVPLNGVTRVLNPANISRRVKVVFACHCCGVAYEARQEHERTSGRFDCSECGTMVHSWAGNYNYTGWTQL